MEEAAQTAERAAHCWLAQSNASGSERNTPLPHQRIERDQQVEINAGKVDRLVRHAARGMARNAVAGMRQGLKILRRIGENIDRHAAPPEESRCRQERPPPSSGPSVPPSVTRACQKR